MRYHFSKKFSLKSLVVLVCLPLSFLPAPSSLPVPSSLPAALPSSCMSPLDLRSLLPSSLPAPILAAFCPAACCTPYGLPPPSLVAFTFYFLPSSRLPHFLTACCLHCKEHPIYVFLCWELRCLSPNFHIHVSFFERFIFSQDRSTYFPAAE
jgi:hypothetical protein